MRIYHGVPSPAKLARCRAAAPSYEHGAAWNPDRMTGHPWPYLLDNGAYAADVNGVEWNPDPFLRRLNDLDERMPRPPEFVVLPDVRGDADASVVRTREWARRLDAQGFDADDYPRAVAVQDRLSRDGLADLVTATDATTVFIGGSDAWKVANARRFVTAAHDLGCDAHIGRPLSLPFADAVGADSVDTTSIVRSENYARLRAFEEQTAVTDFVPTQ